MNEILSRNKDAVVNATVLSAAKLLNARAIKVLTPMMPPMLRGYMSYPIVQMIIANLASYLVKTFRPNDQRLQRFTSAMMVSAYALFIEQFDIDGLIDKVLSDAKVSAAMKAIKDEDLT